MFDRFLPISVPKRNIFKNITKRLILGCFHGNTINLCIESLQLYKRQIFQAISKPPNNKDYQYIHGIGINVAFKL